MQCLFEKCNEKGLHHLKKKRGEARVLYYRLLGALPQHHHCHLYCLLMGAAYRGRVLLAQAFVSLSILSSAPDNTSGNN